MIVTFQGMQTYVIDAFTTHAASGMSPNLVMVRSPVDKTGQHLRLSRSSAL